MKTEKQKLTRASIVKAVETLLETDARSSTVYQHPKMVCKATRRWKPDKRNKSESVVLTFGSPNYRERNFVKMCIEAGEPFPVKKTQLRFYPKN